MPENSTTGNAGAAVPPADGFEAFFSTRVCAAAESSRSPTSAVADAGDGALVAALAFLRQDIRAENQRRDWRALFWRQQLEVNRQPRAEHPFLAGRWLSP